MLLVVVVTIANPVLFAPPVGGELDKWFDLGVWAGLLIVTEYSMRFSILAARVGSGGPEYP